MKQQNCSRCDQMLSPGDRRYVVSIQVCADHDADFGDTAMDDCEKELSWLFGMVDEDEDEDEVSVIQREGKLAFTLCHKCREVFLSNPLSLESPKGLLSMRLH